MTQSAPKLAIFDHEDQNYYRFRYYVKAEKKYKYQMIRYGKRHTKGEAYVLICKKRDELINEKFSDGDSA